MVKSQDRADDAMGVKIHSDTTTIAAPHDESETALDNPVRHAEKNPNP